MGRPCTPFSYPGGKHRSASQYPAPRYPLIIEPFAGSAGYALYHYRRQVFLYEKYEPIFSIWDYLIREATAERILELTDYYRGIDLERCEGLSKAERYLIGINAKRVNKRPIMRPAVGSSWLSRHGADHWGPQHKRRLAKLLPHIKHWRPFLGSYLDAPPVEATWFIDAPYQKQPGKYVHGPEGIDFGQLRDFVLSRRGQIIVCESEGADWLEGFQRLDQPRYKVGSTQKGEAELLWYAAEQNTSRTHQVPRGLSMRPGRKRIMISVDAIAAVTPVGSIVNLADVLERIREQGIEVRSSKGAPVDTANAVKVALHRACLRGAFVRKGGGQYQRVATKDSESATLGRARATKGPPRVRRTKAIRKAKKRKSARRATVEAKADLVPGMIHIVLPNGDHTAVSAKVSPAVLLRHLSAWQEHLSGGALIQLLFPNGNMCMIQQSYSDEVIANLLTVNQD